MSGRPGIQLPRNGNNQHGSGDASNPFYENYTSMSTLASAAQAQAPPPQQQYVPAHHNHANSAFPDLDAHLGLYGDLENQVQSQGYHGYDESNGIAHGHMNGDFGNDSQELNEWYGQPIGNGLPAFLDGYQPLPEQQQNDAPGQLHNDGGAPIPIMQPGAHQVGPLEASGHRVEQQTDDSKVVQQELSRKPHPDRKHVEVADDTPSAPPQSSPRKEKSPLAGNDAPPKQWTHFPSRPLAESSSTWSKEESRPKSSIPSDIPIQEYARQCIIAAYSSRMNPFALHASEHALLRKHLNYLQVTTYLNIRNGILRLWMRNPLLSVTKEEAMGCAKDYRWFGVANVAFQWLVRMGYINFGCVEVPSSHITLTRVGSKTPKPRRKTVVVIGAGMAGLGCARQLEGLFAHHADHWETNGEDLPKVFLVEGRGRIGGRVYSHPLKKQVSEHLPTGLRCTADMGAQIITGFDHGNPLNAIIRGQLALHYHSLKDHSTLYDSDGTPVGPEQDQLVENLFNDILDRSSIYRHKAQPSHTAEGAKELLEIGRDPTGEGGKTIGMVEDATAPIPAVGTGAQSTRNGSTEMVPAGMDKLTGKAFMTFGSSEKAPAITAATAMGWKIKESAGPPKSVNLDDMVKSTQNPTLGAAMDEAVRQYQNLVELSAQDMRLLNWHFANLEYANAANVGDLSLGGWDQDIGNEFEGEHAEIIGGYQQVPRGLWRRPTTLDVRTRKAVKRILYNPNPTPESSLSKIECTDGEVIEADTIISTLPLGVLKDRSVQFEPALPDWKSASIERLGFGTLNKVVLVYEQAFWDKDRDMFGALREPVVEGSLNQQDYVSRRGRFYLFWNCIKTSGRPMLVALMAGDAAHQAETSSDDDLIAEVTNVLKKMFSDPEVKGPSEAIVTRWGKDRFARGSYSYVGPRASSEDYDLMAKPVGNLYFAGEATCGSHPATVHGAYLSGLRAASEVVESMLGPIKVPTPLVPPKVHLENASTPRGTKRKAEESLSGRGRDLKEARLDAYEAEISMAIYEKLGERPTKPGKSGANPFLLYQKNHWYDCKNKCDEARRQATKNPDAKASRNEVRAALGQMWRDAPADEKRPYLEQTASNKEHNATSVADFKKRLQDWDRAAVAFRKEYEGKNPSKASEEELKLQAEAQGSSGHASRRVKKLSGYAEDTDDDNMA